MTTSRNPPNLIVIEGQPPYYRVKLYESRNNAWEVLITGYCQSTTLALTVYDGQPSPENVFIAFGVSDIQGPHQQDASLIVLEYQGTSYALSFAEESGCSEVFAALQIDAAVFFSANGLVQQQELSLDNIHDVAVEFNLKPKSQQVDAQFLSQVVQLFTLAEDMSMLESIGDLHSIMTVIFNQGETLPFEVAVSNGEQFFSKMVAIFEYDTAYKVAFGAYRNFKPEHYVDLIVQNDKLMLQQKEAMNEKIQQIFRLQFMNDVVLARTLDEGSHIVLSQMIQQCYGEILSFITANSDMVLSGIFDELKEVDDTQRTLLLIKFLHELLRVGKSVQQHQERRIVYQLLVSKNVLQRLSPHVFESQLIAEILLSICEFDASLLRQLTLANNRGGNPTVVHNLLDALVQQNEHQLSVADARRLQIMDILKSMLDTENVMVFNMILAKRDNPFSDESRQFLDLFYAKYFANHMLKPIFDMLKQDSIQIQLKEAQHFVYLVELVIVLVQIHRDRCRQELLHNNTLGYMMDLLTCEYKPLKLATIRLLRTLITLNEIQYMLWLSANYHVVDRLMEVLKSTSGSQNLIFSACLELLSQIPSEIHNKPIAKYMVKNYLGLLSNIGAVGQQIIDFNDGKKVQQLPEVPHSIALSPNSVKQDQDDSYIAEARDQLNIQLIDKAQDVYSQESTTYSPPAIVKRRSDARRRSITPVQSLRKSLHDHADEFQFCEQEDDLQSPLQTPTKKPRQ